MAWLDVRCTKDAFADKSDGSATAEREFYAAADAHVPADGALAASAGGVSIPAKRESYSVGRPFCRVVDRKVERLSATQFTVTVRYEDPTDGEAEDEEDLLALPAKVNRAASNVMEQYTVDADGVQVRNTAGEPFDQFPERLSDGATYTISKYVDATTKAAILAAERTTNNAVLTIQGRTHAADTLLLAGAAFEEEGTIFHATMTIHYQPGGWVDKALNAGFTQIVGTESVRIMMWCDRGPKKLIPVTRPWPLNLDGTAKSHGDDPAEELEFHPYSMAAWTGVPLS